MSQDIVYLQEVWVDKKNPIKGQKACGGSNHTSALLFASLSFVAHANQTLLYRIFGLLFALAYAPRQPVLSNAFSCHLDTQITSTMLKNKFAMGQA